MPAVPSDNFNLGIHAGGFGSFKDKTNKIITFTNFKT